MQKQHPPHSHTAVENSLYYLAKTLAENGIHMTAIVLRTEADYTAFKNMFMDDLFGRARPYAANDRYMKVSHLTVTYQDQLRPI